MNPYISNESKPNTVAYNRKKKKKKKKRKDLLFDKMNNTNLKNRGEVSFIFNASHITWCHRAKNVVIQVENVAKTNHCLRFCQKTLHF